MEKPRIVVPLLVVAAAVAVFLMVPESQVAEPELVVPVRVQKISAEPPKQTLVISGTTRSADTAMMRFQVGGRVLTKSVNLGESIEKGDVLATLYNPELEPLAERAQQNLAQVQAEATQAKRDFARIKTLFAEQAVTRQEWERAQTRLTAAAKAVAAAKAELERAEQVSRELQLIAPFSGSVTEVLIDIGEVVSAGAPAVRVSNPASVELSLPVNDQTMERLELGQIVEVRPSVARSNSVFEATIIELSPFREQGALPEVKLALPPQSVRPGTAVTAEITIDGDDGVSLPLRSVLMTGNETVAIYRLNDQQRAELVPIRPLSIATDFIVVDDGVFAGDLVVTEGIAQLYDGAKVRVIDNENTEVLNSEPPQQNKIETPSLPAESASADLQSQPTSQQNPISATDNAGETE